MAAKKPKVTKDVFPPPPDMTDIESPYTVGPRDSDVYQSSSSEVRIYRDGVYVGDALRTGITPPGFPCYPAYRIRGPRVWGPWAPTENYFVLVGGRLYEWATWCDAWRPLLATAK